MATNNAINVPSDTIALAGANANITSMIGLTGTLRAPTSISSAAGLTLLGLNYTASAANFFNIYNNTAGNAPQIGAAGTDSNVGIVLSPKGNAFVQIVDNTGAFPGKLAFSNANNTQHTFLTVASAQATTVTFTLPAADGVSGTVVTSNGAGVWSMQLQNLIQQVSTQTGAVATGTTQIPADDTIPQNTEGDQYLTLSITPKSATSKLRITVTIMYTHSVGTAWAVALFQDSTANALAAQANVNTAVALWECVSFTHTMTSGTTSATTFNVRAGCTNVGTSTVNGTAGGRLYGGVLATSMTITEFSS